MLYEYADTDDAGATVDVIGNPAVFPLGRIA